MRTTSVLRVGKTHKTKWAGGEEGGRKGEKPTYRPEPGRFSDSSSRLVLPTFPVKADSGKNPGNGGEKTSLFPFPPPPGIAPGLLTSHLCGSARHQDPGGENRRRRKHAGSEKKHRFNCESPGRLVPQIRARSDITLQETSFSTLNSNSLPTPSSILAPKNHFSGRGITQMGRGGGAEEGGGGGDKADVSCPFPFPRTIGVPSFRHVRACVCGIGIGICGVRTIWASRLQSSEPSRRFITGIIIFVITSPLPSFTVLLSWWSVRDRRRAIRSDVVQSGRGEGEK